MKSCCSLFDVAGTKVDADHPRAASAGAEIDRDLDFLAHHVLGDGLTIMVAGGPAPGNDDAAIADRGIRDLEGNARRAGRRHQPAPIGIAAVPAALHEIVLDDDLGGAPRFQD